MPSDVNALSARESTLGDELNIYQKVAQFLINVKANKPRETICHALILGVLADEEDGFGVRQVVRKIQEKWKIKVPPHRVSEGLKALSSSGIVNRQEGRYLMDDHQKEQYQQDVRNRVSFFEEVEQDWIETIQRTGKCRQLTVTEKRTIIEDFRAVIGGLCDRYASKVANFLSGGTTQLEQTFVSKEIVACLPASKSRPAPILSVEKKIFPLFFQNADDRRAKYVSGVAQTYIRRTIFEVETQGRSIFEAKMKTLNVYLDTNMIFSLLGFHGPERQEVAEHVVSMNSDLGITTMVDQRSIEEFKSVLDSSRRNGTGLRIPKGIFAEVKKVILEPRYKPEIEFVLPDDPFALLFWASLDEGFVKTARRREILSQWERFLAYFESVDTILSVKYKIGIGRQSQGCIPAGDAFQKTVDLILQAAEKHKIRKSVKTAEHDATMFFLIAKLRAEETPEFLPSNYWLLSADRSLIRFHKSLLGGGTTCLAHFLSIGSWTELMMPFLTIQLVDEKDDAMIVIKSLGEAFQYYKVLRMPPSEVAEVLRRVPEASERGPELVFRCAANRHFRETVHRIVAAEPRSTKEEIDEAVIKAFESVRDQAELTDKSKELKAELERMAQQSRELTGELEAEKKAREETERKLENWDRRLRQIKLGGILLAAGAATACVGYYLALPQFSPFSINAAIWTLGSIYLCFWIWLSVRTLNVTPRTIACMFLPALIVFLIPLLRIHRSDTALLAILVTALLAIVGGGVSLLKRSWLDIRIMLRR